jgi:hypothetical protein
MTKPLSTERESMTLSLSILQNGHFIDQALKLLNRETVVDHIPTPRFRQDFSAVSCQAIGPETE